MNLDDAQIEAARERRLGGMRLQEIGGSPLDAEDLAMFGMFDREEWSHKRRRASIVAQAKAYAVRSAV